MKEYAIFELDPTGHITSWNKGAERLLGYPAESVLGQPIDLFFIPDDRAAGKPAQHLTLAAQQGSLIESCWRVRRDGSRFWGDMVLTALKNDDGSLRGYVKVIRDMTDRLQAEQSNRDAAAQMQGVITTAVDGILAIDERGLIEWLNPAALRIFGYTHAEVIGKNINMLMPEPYHSEHDQYLANYRHTGHKKIIGIGREVKGRRKDGSIFPLDLAVSEVKLVGRRIFTGIVRDITQRKEAERLLIEAKEAAEAASKAKDHFLAMVSHELRTPLNPILAAVSFLESKPDLDPDVQEEISSIRRNIEHETQIVDDLLNLTRLSRGKIELHTEAVDAHAMLRTLLTQFESEFDAKNLVLTTALRAKERFIWADPTRLRQVLTNLLHNAIKFTAEGGQITVRTGNPTGSERLRVEVTDTGIGIEPDVLQRLFSPFEQGEKSITRQFGGLGLGLAISKGIIDLHGGTLTADSAGKDQGATFALELTTVPAVPETPVPLTAASVIPGQRVLLVEDHQDTMRIMTKLLKALGYSVLSASSVKEALRLADQEDFDVLVSDIGLPDGSGLDVLTAIRRKHAIKAIAISGFGQPEDLSRSREAGFLEHIVKPVNFQRLEAVLKQLTGEPSN